jgi:AcrR family transcriptional regulator
VSETRPTSARREVTRARLLDGARQVIADQGVHGASVEAICEAAGFTRGAFYSNFTSRDDLVLAIIADDRARILTEIEEVLADPPDDPARIVAAIQARLADVDSLRRHLVRTELTLYALRSAAVRPDFVRLRREFREGFRRAIDAAAARKGLTLLLETDLLVRTVEALHDGATMQSLLEPDELPLGTLQQEVIPRLLLDD